MGSIVQHQRIDKATGEPVTMYRAHIRRAGFKSRSKLFASKKDAADWLRNNEHDGALVKCEQPKGNTLATLIESFVAAGVCSYAAPAHLAYWRDTLGHLPIAELTHREINGQLLILRTQPGRHRTMQGTKSTGKKLTPATINRYASALSAVLSFAMEHGIIDVHPMKGGRVKKLKEGPGRQRILTAEEEQRLIEAAKASRWAGMLPFMMLLLTSAARKSEILNLRWRDIDLQRGIAVLGKTKNGSPRSLPLVAEVRALLTEAKKVRPLGSDLVFFDPSRPDQPKNVDTLWRIARERAGLNDTTDPSYRVVMHTARHTGVTKILRSGANLAQAALISGHKTLAMLKRYEHLAADDVMKIAEDALGTVGKKKSSPAA